MLALHSVCLLSTKSAYHVTFPVPLSIASGCLGWHFFIAGINFCWSCCQSGGVSQYAVCSRASIKGILSCQCSKRVAMGQLSSRFWHKWPQLKSWAGHLFVVLLCRTKGCCCEIFFFFFFVMKRRQQGEKGSVVKVSQNGNPFLN